MKRIPGEWRYFDEELGIPFPWYTKPALEAIKTWDIEDKSIFEYGVGDSTKWYKAKGAYVSGVDNSFQYASENGAYFENFDKHYIEAIRYDGIKYDIIVIDGVWRDGCTETALKYLKPGGILIIDNYKQNSVQALWPKTEKLIEGMTKAFHKEPEHEDWVTAIIYKSK